MGYRAFSPGGALEAAMEAKQQGLVRSIGVTGHGLQIAATHRRSLERYDFELSPAAYNFITLRQSLLRGAIQRAPRHLSGAQYSGANHQVNHQTLVGPSTRAVTHMVRAFDRSTRDIDLAVHWVLPQQASS